MPCYVCSHCNKCGMFSTVLDLRCNTCGEPIPPGSSTCANCGEKFLGNMRTGKAIRPGGKEADIDGGFLKEAYSLSE